MKTESNIFTANRLFGENVFENKPSTTISLILMLAALVSVFSLPSCNDSNTNHENREVVEVTAAYNQVSGKHYFVTDREEVPSGWVTFRFTNATQYVHFALLGFYPGDLTMEKRINEADPIFQEAVYLLTDGKTDEGFEKLGEIPAWFRKIVPMGGPGMVSGGHTVENTVYLEPGNYSMECYIKMDDGTFHSSVGMIKSFIVTDEESEAPEPTDADIHMTLTNEGLGIEGDLKAGTNKVAVLFDEDEPSMPDKDVHLAKLDGANVEDITDWMDWSRPKGLVSDLEAKAPAEFLGGTHEMPKGNTTYFTIDLEPGNYVWVSERSADNPLYKEFTIPSN